MAFQAGTNRDGFKRALMNAFQSAHKKAATMQTQGKTVPNDKMTGFNPDTRAAGLEPGGHQAGKFPSTKGSEQVLGGGSHPSPAATARGPAGHNNDPRRTGFEVQPRPGAAIKLTGGSATNPHTLEPQGRPTSKIKLPKGQNVDSRGTRGR